MTAMARSPVDVAHDDGGFGLGLRQNLERRLGDEAQRAMRAAGQLHQIEAGDVLHHAAAADDRLAKRR